MHNGMTIRDLENVVIKAEKKAKVLQFPKREVEITAKELLGLDSVFAPLPKFEDGE